MIVFCFPVFFWFIRKSMGLTSPLSSTHKKFSMPIPRIMSCSVPEYCHLTSSIFSLLSLFKTDSSAIRTPVLESALFFAAFQISFGWHFPQPTIWRLSHGIVRLERLLKARGQNTSGMLPEETYSTGLLSKVIYPHLKCISNHSKVRNS